MVNHAHGKKHVILAKDRAKVRSKTFKGIAFAMAEQWGKIEEDESDDSDERRFLRGTSPLTTAVER